jgi:hypothetical protein
MNSAPQFYLVKVFEHRNYPPHFGNGADAQVPSAAVGGAAFAKPEIYQALEERGVKYAIRLPANRIQSGISKSYSRVR